MKKKQPKRSKSWIAAKEALDKTLERVGYTALKKGGERSVRPPSNIPTKTPQRGDYIAVIDRSR